MQNDEKELLKADISITENIIAAAPVSANSILLDDIDFLSRIIEINIAYLNCQLNNIKDKTGSLGKMNGDDFLQLQAAIDRVSRFEGALSNVIKKGQQLSQGLSRVST